MNKRIDFDNDNLILKINKYSNNRIRLDLISDKVGQYATITKNLPEVENLDKFIAINTETLKSGIYKKLQEEGLLKHAGCVSYNFEVYNVAEINMEKLQEYDIEGYQKYCIDLENKLVNDLYEMFKRDYIEQGYMYSACIPVNSVQVEAYKKEINELLDNNVIRMRKCEGLAYELVPEERKKLIEEEKLKERWDMKCPGIYVEQEINGVYKEINQIEEYEEECV